MPTLQNSLTMLHALHAGLSDFVYLLTLRPTDAASCRSFRAQMMLSQSMAALRIEHTDQCRVSSLYGDPFLRVLGQLDVQSLCNAVQVMQGVRHIY